MNYRDFKKNDFDYFVNTSSFSDDKPPIIGEFTIDKDLEYDAILVIDSKGPEVHWATADGSPFCMVHSNMGIWSRQAAEFLMVVIPSEGVDTYQLKALGFVWDHTVR